MWRTQISAEKKKAVVISKKTKLQLPKLKLQNATIYYVPNFRYLGIILDQRLRWRKKCEVLRGKTLRSLAAIKPLLRSTLSLKAKLNIYKTYIRSVMTYATPAWVSSPKQTSAVCKLSGIGYNGYTRVKQMHLDIKIQDFKNYIKILASEL